jgi:hypothetical protein
VVASFESIWVKVHYLVAENPHLVERGAESFTAHSQPKFSPILITLKQPLILAEGHLGWTSEVRLPLRVSIVNDGPQRLDIENPRDQLAQARLDLGQNQEWFRQGMELPTQIGSSYNSRNFLVFCSHEDKVMLDYLADYFK